MTKHPYPELPEGVNELSRKEKELLIQEASVYKHADFYMGSMAMSSLIVALNGEYGKHSLKELLPKATDGQISKALMVCSDTIKYMLKAGL